MKQRATIVLGIVLSALFLYLAIRGARMDEMFANLARANYWYMIPCFALTLGAFWLRALRWKLLLIPIRSIPQATVFSATMIGFLANNVLPARLGELVRAHVVGRRAGISRSAALASIVVERIFDLFTLLALFGVVALVSEFPGGLDLVALIVLLIGFATLALLVVWNRRPGVLLAMARIVLPARIRPRGEEILIRFREGLRSLDHAANLLLIGGLSLVMWAAILVVVWLSIVAVSIDVPQPQAAMVALVGIALVTMVPSAPGFIGTLQGGGVAALLVFGVPKEEGFAFTIVFHATQWIPVNAAGLYYLVREGLSLGQLGRLASGPEGQGGPGDGAGGNPADANPAGVAVRSEAAAGRGGRSDGA